MCRYYLVTWLDDTSGMRFSWTEKGCRYKDAIQKLKERQKYMPWQNVKIVTKKQLKQLRRLYNV